MEKKDEEDLREQMREAGEKLGEARKQELGHKGGARVRGLVEEGKEHERE